MVKKLKKPPKGSTCETMTVDDSPSPINDVKLKRCGKPATNVVMAIFETWVCKECYDKMEDTKYQKKI